MRFRLLECRQCHERAWTVDDEPPEDDWHEWWERFTFFGEDQGPGLHPLQKEAA